MKSLILYSCSLHPLHWDFVLILIMIKKCSVTDHLVFCVECFQGDSGRLKLTLVQDALAQLMKTQYPVEELLQSPLPQGMDPQHLEVYLSDQDFQAINSEQQIPFFFFTFY